jgi:hypothetical protein
MVDKDSPEIDPLALSSELDRIIAVSDRMDEHLWRKHHSRHELLKENRLELTRAVISFGQGAIRSLTLINGGAAISVLTFLGNQQDSRSNLNEALANSLLLFSFGLTSAALLAGFAYVTQYIYDNSVGRVSKLGVSFHIVSILSAITSLALFVSGMLVAYNGFIGTMALP